MGGIGFIPALWVSDALHGGAFPSPRAHIAASIIADAADRDGRWCFLCLDTLVARSGGLLSLSTAKRAIKDLTDAGVVRKLPRSEVPAFFTAELAAGRRRADNLPDVLELLIPASAFTRHDPAVLEEINEVRARLGEEPLTPHNRPDLQAATTTGQIDPPRQVNPNPRDRSDRPTDPSPADPSPIDPSPDPIRERSTTGSPPLPRQRIPRDIASWALELLARIPDGALYRPHLDRNLLATRLVELRAQGIGVDELARAVAGWEHTARPFAALHARLASPATVRDWNARALLRPLSAPPEPPDAFSRPPEFTLDPQGRADRTCPDHPSIRNTPGGACTVCGGPCRTHPGETVHPFAAAHRDDTLERLFGPPDIDERFTAPKCDNEHCNPDKASPRYRTLIHLTPDGDPTAAPCPTCGHRTRTAALAA